MGFLYICKGKELLKYGSKFFKNICNCVSKNDPNSIYIDGSLNANIGQGRCGVYSKGLKISMAKSCLYAVHNNNILVLELKAILESVIYVKKNNKVRLVDIFSDSEDALTQLQVLLNGQNPLLSRML